MLEAAAIVYAIATFATAWQGRRVVIHCDALGTVIAFNDHSSKSPDIMSMIRTAWWLCSLHSIHLRIVHVAGTENQQADSLSRNKVQPSACYASCPACPAAS